MQIFHFFLFYLLLFSTTPLLSSAASDLYKGQAIVKLTKYEPNELTYDISSTKGGIVVFSEIYYPGWTATVDGEPVTVGRVDYVLRAINVKAGKHKVVLTFKPKSIRDTETVAYIAFALLFIAIIGGVWFEERKKRKAATNDNEKASID